MIRITNCPCCSSSNIKKLRDLKFNSPNVNKQDHFDKMVHNLQLERLYILFNILLKNEYNQKNFELLQCLDCHFIYINPRMTESENINFYDAVKEFDLKKYKGIDNDKLYKS